MKKIRTFETLQRDYVYEGQVYSAKVTFKNIRSMTMRYNADKGLRVSVPRLTSIAHLDEFVRKHLPRLLARVPKKRPLYEDGYLYVLGKKEAVGELEENEIIPYYKKIGLPYFKGRVEHYKALMGIDLDYKVRLRDMKRTYGSNSRRSKTLTFQARLMAFPPEIVDSVVVHELAHHFHYDHSKRFYAVVYRYCPEYDRHRKDLIHDRFDLHDHLEE